MKVGGRSITTHGPELVTVGGSRWCTQQDKPTHQPDQLSAQIAEPSPARPIAWKGNWPGRRKSDECGQSRVTRPLRDRNEGRSCHIWWLFDRD